jgi:GNAT superfamily N-acetyltransferase
MNFLPLTADRLRFRLAEDPEAVPGWFEARIQDYLTYDPDGSFALEKNGSIIGMVTTVCYQRTGWIGWLYVTPSERGHGLGEMLMRRAIDHILSRRIHTVLLEAVVEAVSLYKRLGCTAQFHTQHYQLSTLPEKVSDETGVSIVPVRTYATTRLAAFDQRFFHEDRARLLDVVRRNFLFSGFVAERSGQIAGYICGTESAAKWQVGPFIVDPYADLDGTVRQALIRALPGQSSKPLHFRCPLVESNQALPLEAEKAQKVDYHTVRMYFGKPHPGEQPGVLSLGCPGKG